MFQSEFLAERERLWKKNAHRQLILRIAYVIRNVLISIFSFIGFAVMAYVMIKLPTPEGMPRYVWSTAFLTAIISYLYIAVYYLFATLDELVYDRFNPRRITGRRI